jgi:hypothetical protein
MNEQLLSLFKSVPQGHPLHQVVESVVLPELQHPVTIEISDHLSDYPHFTNIYKRRYNHLTEQKIENHGLLESIESMAAHSGKKRSGSIQTQNYRGYFWVDLELNNLLGLTLVAKQPDDSAEDNRP